MLRLEVAVGSEVLRCETVLLKKLETFAQELNRWIPIDGSNHQRRTEFFRKIQNAKINVILKVKLDNSTYAIVEGRLSEVRPYTVDYPQLNFAVTGTMQRFRGAEKLNVLSQFGLIRFSAVESVYIPAHQQVGSMVLQNNDQLGFLLKRALRGVFDIDSGKPFNWAQLHERQLANYDDLLDVCNFLSKAKSRAEIKMRNGDLVSGMIDQVSPVKSLEVQLWGPIFINGKRERIYGLKPVDIDTIRRLD